MSDQQNGGIAWTDVTANVAGGCAKISAGCMHCYADKMAKVNPKVHGTWGPNGARVIHTPWRLTMAALNRKAQKQGRILRVFINSMCDPCEGAHGPGGESREGPRPEYVPLLATILDTAEACPHLTLQMLTKRPWNLVSWWQASGRAVWPRNLHVGVSVENQEAANKRIDWLLKIPAKVRILSCEPLLGELRLGQWLADESEGVCDGPFHRASQEEITMARGIQWVIVGGESGPKSRPAHPDWFRSIQRQCENAGVSYFFKQHGDYIARSQTTRRHPWHAERTPGGDGWRVEVPEGADWGTITVEGQYFPNTTPFNGRDDDGDGEVVVYRVGKAAAGNFLDGKQYQQMPDDGR